MAHKKALLQLGPCPECGKHFESRYVKTYCGMKCYVKSPVFKAHLKANNDRKKADAAVKGECLQCGAEFFAKASRKQKFCSKNHYRAYMAERFDRWIASPQAIALPQAYDEFLTLDELPCLIEGCDWHGQNLGNHLNFAHGLTADEFKRQAGFNKTTGLVTPSLSQHLASRPHLAYVSFTAESRLQANPAVKKGKPSLEAKEHQAKARALAAEDPVTKTRTCNSCGKAFQQESHFGLTKYCSLECRAAYYSRTRRPIVTLICSECGKLFQSRNRDQQKRHAKGLPVFDTYSCRQAHNGRFRGKTKKGVA